MDQKEPDKSEASESDKDSSNSAQLSSENEQADQGPAHDPEPEMSADEIDQMILSEDPEFGEELASMDSLKDAEVMEFSEASDDLEFEEEAKQAQQLKEDAHPLIVKFRKKVVIPFKNTRDRWQLRIEASIDFVTNNSVAAYKGSVQFLKHTLPDFIKYLGTQFTAFKLKLKTYYQSFMSLSLIKRLTLLVLAVMATASLYFAAMIFKDAWLERLIHKLPTSLASSGQVIGSATSKSDFVAFNVAFPDYEYQVKLNRVVVNLRRDANSGPLPMGAFEFFLGLDSQDTAIEVKDREKEILDRVQRQVEQMTYSEVMSPTGKTKMKVKVRDSINEILNQGRVTGVYINTMITNH